MANVTRQTKSKTEHIGQATVLYPSPNAIRKPAQELDLSMLDIFSADNPEHARNETLSGSPSWEYVYHLSPQRRGLVAWYNFQPGTSVLEIGAEYGSVTEALVKNDTTVTVFEPDANRARVNAHRNHTASNLLIVVDDAENAAQSLKKYDYIVCANIMEGMSALLDDKNRSVPAFLERAKDLLAPQGRFIFALSNRFGLRYLAGAREETTNDYFDSLNRYPDVMGYGLGRKELDSMLADHGFRNASFYYPYPDHQLPSIIYSDDFYPGNGAEFPLNSLPTPTPGRRRIHLFSESLAMLGIESNRLFPDLSNSFIVVAES